MKVTEAVGVAGSIVTVVLGVLVFSLDRSVKTFDTQLKLREAERLDVVEQRQTVQQQTDVRFRIYDAVVGSLEPPNAGKQRVATALVLAMLEPEDTLRSGLLQVLTTEAAPAIKAQASEALAASIQFTAQQRTVTPETAPAADQWRSYSLDIFWCGSADSAKATRVQQALQQAGATGRIRVRELAPSINSSPGYRIAGLIIRREATEQSAAEAIKQIADPIVGGGREGFALTSSTQGTPGYLSLFVCQ